MRKVVELTEINEYGYIGYRFEDSKRFASSKVLEDSNGKYFISKKEKFYIEYIKQQNNNLLEDMYRCNKCGKISGAEAWNTQTSKVCDGDYKPIEDVDFNNLDFDPHAFECPICLETCYIDDRDIELI